MDLEVEVGEGDILKFNDVWWSVKNIREHNNEIDMIAHNSGRVMTLEKEDIHERVRFSGQFRIIREEYKEVIDF